MPEDRRLAAIMFTDIVGYTALMGKDEDKAFQLLRKNRNIQRPLIKKYHGKWLKEMGDGILASFNSASDAVRCAIEIQQASKKEGVPLRIGIHEGEVVFEGGDVLGDGVNIASRLEEFAEEGAINISGTVYKDIKNKAGIEAEFIEEKVLKNVDEPVKVYRVKCEEPEEEVMDEKPSKNKMNKLLYYIIGGLTVIIIAFLIWQYLPKEKTTMTGVMTSADKSIAVLPFRNDSPDPENEYFCNGMMETILNHLVKVGDLKVMSRTDVEPYRETQKSRKEIASELGVANILEGSVQKQGNKFRIMVQLISPESGFHLWSNAYEGEYTEEIFAVQSDIAREVASALKAVITSEEEESIESPPTADIKAYDFMIRGRYEVQKYYATRDTKPLTLAHKLIDKALEIDPQYVEAISAKSGAFVAERNYDSAYIYAKRVLEIDPESAVGYMAMGEYYRFQGQIDAAIDNYQLALKHYKQGDMIRKPWAEFLLGYLYCYHKNDYAKGMQYIQKAIDGTEDELKSATWGHLADIFHNIGDYERAEKYNQKLFESEWESEYGVCWSVANYLLTYLTQGKYNQAINFLDTICGQTMCEYFCMKGLPRAYILNGQYDQAEKYYNQFLDGTGTPSATDSIWLAYLYKELGREQEVLTLLNSSRISQEKRLSKNRTSEILIRLALIHAILDEKEEAIEYLSEAVDIGTTEVTGWHNYLEFSPLFKNLTDDPEFKAIVKRAQDEKAAQRAIVQEMIDSGEIDL